MTNPRSPHGDELRAGEHETYRRALQARRAFGGGACTLLVLGTDRGRVLLLHHGTTEAAADLDRDQARELAGYLSGAAGRQA